MSESNKVIILTHEYLDKSGFHICGVTRSMVVATAWCCGAPDNFAYEVEIDDIHSTPGVSRLEI